MQVSFLVLELFSLQIVVLHSGIERDVHGHRAVANCFLDRLINDRRKKRRLLSETGDDSHFRADNSCVWLQNG
jgi:hypothetical protein